MNRSERRRNRSSNRENTYVLTESQIEEIRREAVRNAAVEILAVPCLALHDKFGFGKIRLTRFMDSAMNWYEMAMAGEVSVETMRKTLREETGVTFFKCER